MENIPKLRFSAFTEAWEVKKLKNIAEINPAHKKLPDSFIYIDLESVESGILKKEKHILKTEAPSRAQRILQTNDILFQMVRPYQMNNLFFDKLGNYVASTGYAQIRTHQNSRYLFQYLHYPKFVDKVIENCTGTSYPAINSSDLSNIPIALPCLKEQQKIADFFTAIDDKLFHLKKKKNLLEQYKKGMMQAIFTQKLRFKKDNGEDYPNWDKKILDELAVIKSGLAKEQNLNQEGVKVTRIETISHGVIDLEKTGYVIPPINIASYKLNKGDILFSNINSVSHIGKTAILKNDLDLYHGMNLLCLKSFNNIYALFLFYFLNTNYIKIYFQSICNQAISQASINQTELGKTLIMLPCLEEQKKIADFLSAIDDKITNSETQIKKMESWKKGLLQQMFV